MPEIRLCRQCGPCCAAAVSSGSCTDVEDLSQQRSNGLTDSHQSHQAARRESCADPAEVRCDNGFPPRPLDDCCSHAQSSCVCCSAERGADLFGTVERYGWGRLQLRFYSWPGVSSIYIQYCPAGAAPPARPARWPLYCPLRPPNET